MDTSTQWLQLFTLLVYTLPELIACIVGMVLLWRSPSRGPARRRGLLGIGLIVFSFASHFVLGAIQNLLIVNAVGAHASTAQVIGAIGILSFLATCVFAAGLLVLVLALCQVLHDERSPASATP